MADTSGLTLRFAEETTFGTAATGTYQELRVTSESFNSTQDSKFSEEIRGDRQNSAVNRLNRGAGGDIGVELSYGTYDAFLEAGLLSSDWSSAVDVTATDIDAAAGDNSFNDASSGFAGIADGDIIFVSGFSNAANNGVFRVVTATTAKLIVEGDTLVTEAAGPSVTVSHPEYVENGTEKRQFTFEKEYTDVSSVFPQFTGQTVGGFSIQIPLDSEITGTFNFVGKVETSPTPTSTGASGNTAATTTSPFAAVADVEVKREAASSFAATAISFNVENALRPRREIGALGAASIGAGTVAVTGSISAYFANVAMANKFLAFTSTNLTLVVLDQAGNRYVFDFPQVKFSSKSNPTPGKDQDVMLDLEWMAYRHGTYGYTCRVYRIPA